MREGNLPVQFLLTLYDKFLRITRKHEYSFFLPKSTKIGWVNFLRAYFYSVITEGIHSKIHSFFTIYCRNGGQTDFGVRVIPNGRDSGEFR